jgi:hypothetical protein
LILFDLFEFRGIDKSILAAMVEAAALMDAHGFPIFASGSDVVVGYDDMNGLLRCEGCGDGSNGIGKILLVQNVFQLTNMFLFSGMRNLWWW